MTKTIITFLAVGGLLLGANAQASMEMNYFDANGASNSVTLELTGESVSITDLNKNAVDAESVSHESSNNFMFDMASISGSISKPAFTASIASTDRRINLTSASTAKLGTSTATSSAYTSTGLVKMPCDTGCVSVTYDYSDPPPLLPLPLSAAVAAVPAPTALLLIGAGLLGFAGVRRTNKPS